MGKLAALTATLLALALPSIANAQPQSPEEQACITGVNKAGAKVAKTQGSEASKCVKAAGKGTVASLEACVVSDVNGKVADAAFKVNQTANEECDNDAPDFGYIGPGTTSTAAIGETQELLRDLLGADLDAAVISSSSDKDGARCQAQVSSRLAKLLDAKLAAFNACKKDGLAGESITSRSGLTDCVELVAAGISTKVAKALSKVADTLLNKCPAALGTVLPGDCSGTPTADCLDRISECRACRMLNTADVLASDCDTIDDDVVNGSCDYNAVTTTTTTTTLPADCAAVNFLDVSGAPGPGGTYSSLHPSLSASCSTNTVTVQSNGIPTYQYVALTPNGLQAKSYNFTFPRYPTAAVSTTNIPLLGNVGVAVNGIPIYGVNEGAMPASDAYGDPIAAAILDECGSHSAQAGTFHNHQLFVKCLIQSAVTDSQPWNNPDPSPTEPSPIVGYAFDGFPIYGPYECVDVACSSVQKMLSSWDNTGYQAGTVGCSSSASCTNGYCTEVMIGGAETTACVPKTCVWSNNDYTAKIPSAYLDQCNGHTGPLGDYHYHTTSTFPYTLGCYRGTPTSNGGTGTPPGGTCP